MNGKVYINSICDRCAHVDVCSSIKDNRQKCGSYLEERPHGEWIYHKEWECDGECAFECSKCGMGTDVDYNFCPNCGADMRKEGEEGAKDHDNR